MFKSPNPSTHAGACSVDVAYARPERFADEEVIARLSAILSAEEHTRYRRFHFAQHRHEYLVAHALVRAVLGRRLGCPGQELRFTSERGGKPELASTGEATPPLRFNLSHTAGLVVCAITAEAAVGVDVECEQRAISVQELASKVLSEHERRALNGLAESELRERFVRYWTLKEAYVKAVGKGLSLPLRSVMFDLDRQGEPRVAFAPPANDTPEAWRFAQQRLGERHVMAVAVRTCAPLALTVREWSG